MATPLESLSLELVEPIFDHLELGDLSRLSRCNRAFHSTLSPRILAADGALNLMMRWAIINGNTWTIKRAVSLGADVHFVKMDQDERYGSMHFDKILTLHLAAREDQIDCFQTLLDSGADAQPPRHPPDNVPPHRRFNSPSFPFCRTYLFNHKKPPDLLRRCLDSGIRDSILELQWQMDEALKQAAANPDVPESFCEAWISLGADPSRALSYFCDRCRGMFNTGSVVRTHQFLSRGANLVKYTQAAQLPGCDEWAYRPVLAAASSMAKYGMDMMQVCLDHGADVNIERMEPVDYLVHQDDLRAKKVPVTPMLVYLLSADIYTGRGSEYSPQTRAPYGLQYLLDKGAKVPLAHRDLKVPLCGQASLPVLELFWRRWMIPRRELHADFGTMWELLCRHGPTAEAVPPARLLILGHLSVNRRGKRRICRAKKPNQCGLLKRRWRVLLDMVLKDGHDNVFGQRDVDRIFLEFVELLNEEMRTGEGATTRGTTRGDLSWNCTHSITIDKFCEVGVDISKAFRGAHPTVLNHLLELTRPKKQPRQIDFKRF